MSSALPSDQNVMSRGAFLATSAVAATAATLRGFSGHEAHEPMLPSPQTGPCDALLNCRAAPDKWSVPAGTLNALWSDVFPRLVAAYWWERAAYTAAGRPEPWMVGWQKAQFRSVFATTAGNPLNVVAAPALPCPPGPPAAPTINSLQGSSTFEVRKQQVHDHLGQSTSIPINIVGEGEFDFILSDQGLDLFIPREPEKLRDLVRYFTFRGTGRRPIGIPFYLGEYGSAIAVDAVAKAMAMSTDSPTGPSQILMNTLAVEAQIMAISAPALAQNPGVVTCVEEVLHCLRAKVNSGSTINTTRPPRFGGDPQYYQASRRIAEAVLTRDKTNPRPELRIDPRDIATLQRGPQNQVLLRDPVQVPQAVTMTLEEYACLMKPTRCWQISGSVYRGIMTDLPRVVANMWLEELDQVPSAVADNSYRAHFARNNADSGIRQIFRDRLETSLPDPDHMQFQTFSPTDPKNREVMITNKGFLIPNVETFFPTGATEQARKQDIYLEIMKGRAGNPVFTDSIQCW